MSKIIQFGGFLARFLGPLLKAGLPLTKNLVKTTVIISNDEMGDIIKIVKSLEDSGLLVEGVPETVENEVKEQKGGFLSMLLGTIGASWLGNLLTSRGINRAGEGVLRAGYGNNKMDF